MKTQGFQKGQEIKEDIHNDYCNFTFPKKAVIGKKFTVTLDKKVPNIIMEIGNGIRQEKLSRLVDPNRKELILADTFIKKYVENTSEISVILENVTHIHGKKVNTLEPCDLLVGVYAFGNEEKEEEAKIIKIECVRDE